jgi:hypothetical protein
LLRIIAGDASDDSVTLSQQSLAPGAPEASSIDPRLVRRSLVLSALLIAVFLLMLYLSGWL